MPSRGTSEGTKHTHRKGVHEGSCTEHCDRATRHRNQQHAQSQLCSHTCQNCYQMRAPPEVLA